MDNTEKLKLLLKAVDEFLMVIPSIDTFDRQSTGFSNEECQTRYGLLCSYLDKFAEPDADIKLFKCPECESTDCWFDRSISYYVNENGIEEEDGMHMRCSGCGKTFEELEL